MRRVFLLATLIPAALGQTLSFGTPEVYGAGQGPLAIATGDLNGDGKPDIAVANASTSDVSIYLNNGDGTFTVGPSVGLPSDCLVGYIAIGSFVAKGAADLLAVCTLSDVTMIVVPNVGKGRFGTPVRVTLPPPADEAWAGNYVFAQLDPAVADFNGDGLTDIVLAAVDQNRLSHNSGVPILDWYFVPSKGGGAFGAAAPLNMGAAAAFVAFSIAAGDFNGDRKLDLIGAAVPGGNSSSGSLVGSIEIFFAAGNGDGTFQALTPVSLPGVGSEDLGTLLIPADVNGDSKLDLVITGSSLVDAALLSGTGVHTTGYFTGVSEVAVLLGDGTGHFTQSYYAGLQTYMSGAVLGNFLGTGKLDLAATTAAGDFIEHVMPSGGLEVFPGVGDGTFDAPVSLAFPSSTIATGLAVADFNGDGKPDLAFPGFPAIPLPSFRNNIALNSGTVSVLTLLLAALPSGSAEVLLNTTAAAPPTFTDANGASFANGPQAVDSIVSAFGTGLDVMTAGAASLPLPTTLGGVTIEVKDSAGVTRQAPLFYVSPQQINYAIPDGTADGAATVTIQSTTGAFVAQQQIVSVAPGIFNANGLAVGTAEMTVNGQQQQTTLVSHGATVPIDVSGGETFLTLYGTGIRNHVSAVTATVGTVANVPVAYAGAQGSYFGEDQINIQLPASLQGAGSVNVSLNVDSQTSNMVRIAVK